MPTADEQSSKSRPDWGTGERGADGVSGKPDAYFDADGDDEGIGPELTKVLTNSADGYDAGLENLRDVANPP